MTDQDRIRVWNEETSEMMEPATIQELLCREHRVAIRECDDDLSHAHLVFMRNTEIYDNNTEIFAEDLVTHSDEKWLYRVMQKRGCWWAMSLRTDMVPARLLNSVYDPHIVGNVFENRDLVLKGEVIDG